MDSLKTREEIRISSFRASPAMIARSVSIFVGIVLVLMIFSVFYPGPLGIVHVFNRRNPSSKSWLLMVRESLIYPSPNSP